MYVLHLNVRRDPSPALSSSLTWCHFHHTHGKAFERGSVFPRAACPPRAVCFFDERTGCASVGISLGVSLSANIDGCKVFTSVRSGSGNAQALFCQAQKQDSGPLPCTLNPMVEWIFLQNVTSVPLRRFACMTAHVGRTILFCDLCNRMLYMA